jgi:hypothetical protein
MQVMSSLKMMMKERQQRTPQPRQAVQPLLLLLLLVQTQVAVTVTRMMRTLTLRLQVCMQPGSTKLPSSTGLMLHFWPGPALIITQCCTHDMAYAGRQGTPCFSKAATPFF